MALKSKNLPTSCWQLVLPDVLHSIRTLLCTSTNQTPHERMFTFPRRSGTGVSLPTWLATPGQVLLRRFVRNSKYEPLVDEVELLQANNSYAHIRYPGGREDTVSTHDLAPMGSNASGKPCGQEPPLPGASTPLLNEEIPSDLTETNIDVDPNIDVDSNVKLAETTLNETVKVLPPSPLVMPDVTVKETTPFIPRVSTRSTKGQHTPRLNL